MHDSLNDVMRDKTKSVFCNLSAVQKVFSDDSHADCEVLVLQHLFGFILVISWVPFSSSSPFFLKQWTDILPHFGSKRYDFKFHSNIKQTKMLDVMSWHKMKDKNTTLQRKHLSFFLWNLNRTQIVISFLNTWQTAIINRYKRIHPSTQAAILNPTWHQEKTETFSEKAINFLGKIKILAFWKALNHYKFALISFFKSHTFWMKSCHEWFWTSKNNQSVSMKGQRWNEDVLCSLWCQVELWPQRNNPWVPKTPNEKALSSNIPAMCLLRQSHQIWQKYAKVVFESI